MSVVIDASILESMIREYEKLGGGYLKIFKIVYDELLLLIINHICWGRVHAIY